MDGLRYYVHYTIFTDGWWMGRVMMDSEGKDSVGWYWGRGKPLFHFTNGLDSCTVRADSPVEALAIIMVEGWPPTKTGRYNWEYGKEDSES